VLSERKIDSADESERTCVGCRRRDARSALLRFAIRKEAPRLVPDPMKRLPGRGVSVHPHRACITRAVSGGLARVVQGKLDVDADALCAMAAEQYHRRVDGLLLAGSRTRSLALGTEAVKRAIDNREAAVLVFASDAAGSKDDLMKVAGELRLDVREHGTKSELGRLFGRDELGVLAILDPGIASEVAIATMRAAQLLGADPRSQVNSDPPSAETSEAK
jgi:uncharacterized protein